MKTHLSPESFPVNFKGRSIIFQQLTLHLQTIINTPKPFPVSVPIQPKIMEVGQIQQLETLVNIQIIEESQCEAISKGKYPIRQDFFYIYFPSEFRVDEKIYRKYLRSYENMLDEVPRALRMNFQRLIVWDQGRGEHSTETQKAKINEALSAFIKQLVDGKILSIFSEIRQFQNQKPTPKSLHHAFLLKNKLHNIFSLLQLSYCSTQVLSDTWQQIMLNFRCLMKLAPSKGPVLPQKLDYPQDFPRAPYVFTEINDILCCFEHSQSTAYLRIVTFCFFNLFNFCLKTRQTLDAIVKLKKFLDFILSHVLVLNRKQEWSKEQMMFYDVCRNIWALEIITNSFDKIEQLKLPHLEILVGKEDESKKLYISICSMQRNAIERIGLLIYKFDNFSIFPKEIRKQLIFVASKIHECVSHKREKKIVECQEDDGRGVKEYGEIPQISRQNNLRLRDLVSQKMQASPQVHKILVSIEGFGQVYLKSLAQMLQALKISPYPRVARSLNLTFIRTVIMIGSQQLQSQMKITKNIFTGIFDSLSTVCDLYSLFFVICFNKDIQETQKQFLLKTISNPHLTKYHEEWTELISTLNQALDQKIQSWLENRNQSNKCLQMDGQKKKIKFIIDTDIFEPLSLKAQKVTLMKYKVEHEIEFELKLNEINFQKNQMTATLHLPKGLQSQLFIFQIDCIQFEIKVNQSLIVHAKYFFEPYVLEINAPTLRFKSNSTHISKHIWTPFTFQLTGFTNHTVLKSIQAKFKRNEEIQGSNIEVSEDIYVQKINLNKQKRKNSYSEEINSNYEKLFKKLRVSEANERQSIEGTIFLKGGIQDIQQVGQLGQLSIVLILATQKEYHLIRKVKGIEVKPFFTVSYLSLHGFEQFTLKNIGSFDFCIQQTWGLQPDEELCLCQRNITFSPLSFRAMKTKVNLNQLVDQKSLIELNESKERSFKISYLRKPVYHCFEKIQIISEIEGNVKINGYKEEGGNDFQMIGKLEGKVRMKDQILDLWIVPIKPGNLVLPDIEIDGKKGIWDQSMIMGVQ